MINELENHLTIMLGNLDQASREAGYTNAKFNREYTPELEAEHSTLRSYSLRLIGLIRDAGLGKLTVEELRDIDYSYPQLTGA